ncbi:MAG: glycosyltransferase family 39 protein [Clostridiales bacterium]|nr:glycosyltransferase family 39 protein [Clostridiales bacterium]
MMESAKKKNWQTMALIFILMMSVFLSYYGVWKQGYANSYYTATVKSMLTSWHNFFYASYDPSGFVTVDKPAFGLWIQAIFAFVFGVHGWSVILPEAISTVISTYIIYHLVQRSFGKNAGLISALIFSLTPILIAVSRTNNLDASLIVVLLFATWALIVAAEKGSLKHLLISMVLVGLGFNIKMLQAFMILPAFYMVYLITSNTGLGKRIKHSILAIIVLVAVSFSWAIAVDLTPKDNRPYIGSSSTNSVIELALGYNGIQRLLGRTSSKTNVPEQPNMNQSQSQNFEQMTPPNQPNMEQGTPPDIKPNFQQPPQDMQQPNLNGEQKSNQEFNLANDFKNMKRPNGNMGNGGVGGVGENGNKGIFRIFNSQLGGQIGWLVPMALFGVLTLAINTNRKDKNVTRHLILWSLWLFPMIAFFSIAGFFHRYYLSMLAPSIAALSGIGITMMWKEFKTSSWRGYLLPASIVITSLVQALILSRNNTFSSILIPVVLGLGIISASALVILKNKKINQLRMYLITGLLAILISPAIWAACPMIYGDQSVIPVAGPQNGRMGMGGMPGDIKNTGKMPMNSLHNNIGNEGINSSLIKYLQNHRNGEKYLVAVSSSHTADSIILQYGESVMTYGGFSGSDPILTVEKLKTMVENGEIRYFAVGGMGGNQSEVINWVKQNGKEVQQSEWLGTNSESNQIQMGRESITLYDLAPNKK